MSDEEFMNKMADGGVKVIDSVASSAWKLELVELVIICAAAVTIVWLICNAVVKSRRGNSDE